MKYMSLINLIGITATMFLFAGLSNLFCIYIIPILMNRPILAEIIAYCFCGALIISGDIFKLKPMTNILITMLGLVGLYPMLCWTLDLHTKINPENGIELVFCALIWGIYAYKLQSELIGTMCFMALFCFFGFFVQFSPFCYVVGFSDKDSIPKCMGIALIFICEHIYAALHNLHNLPYYIPFNRPVQLLAGFVYFLCGLIISNKWYSWNEDDTLERYIWINFITIGSSLAIYTIGSNVSQLSYLRGMACVFFALMIIEKYFEISWDSIGTSWAMTGLAGILYGCVLLMNQYPGIFE